MDRREAIKQSVFVLGYTISMPVLAGILDSCNGPDSLSWSPKVFNKDQALLMADLAETILPKTATPGASELQLARFADQLIHQVFSAEDRDRFLEGMNQFDETCKELNGKNFLKCSVEEKGKMLSQAELASAKTPGSIWGFPTSNESVAVPFYRKAKELILTGFFTSEQIGKNVLVYNPVPGKFQADIPVSEAGNVAFE